MEDIYGYAASVQYIPGTDLAGYKVEATDGHIGKVDDATDEVGAAFIVVDTGPWIFGKHVLLPAGIITRIDHDDDRIHVARTRQQIKDAPQYNPDAHRHDAGYREGLGTYYSSHNR